MLAALFLVAATLAGFAVVTRLAPGAPTIVRLPGGFLVGIVVTSWTTYLVTDFFDEQFGNPLQAGVIVSTVLSLMVVAVWGRHLRPRHLRIGVIDALMVVVSLAFSIWLMHQRLRYDSVGDHPLVVSANTWGDFGLHISLSRSFAVGGNYPTQYPFFSGEPIRYHFGFDFFAGALQDAGFSVLNSFNIPGFLGFASMMLMLFALARLLFSKPAPDGGKVRWWRDRGVWAGFVAVLILMTNQSLEWLRYIKRDAHGSVWHALDPSLLWHHENYLSIGPYDADRISIFNTLNPYLTQTHLIVAMAFVLFVAYLLLDQLRLGTRLSRPLIVFLGATFGMSFWLNGVLWIAATVFFGALLFLHGAGAVWRRRRASGTEEPAATAEARAAEPPGTTGATGTTGGTGAEGRATWLEEPGDQAARTATASGDAWPDAGDGAVTTRRGDLVGWLVVGACFLVPALVLGLPQAVWLNGGSTDGGSLSVHLGYLVCSSPHAACNARGHMDPFSLTDWGSFVTYWWLNEGLVLPLVLLAFVLGNARDRKIILAITAIFVWGSIFELGRDLGGQNHKTFNLWDNLNGLFVGFAVVQLWVGVRRVGARLRGAKLVRGVLRVGVVFVVFFLCMSGLLDLMTVKNDFKVGVFGDPTEQSAIKWIDGNTPDRAVFLVDFDQLYSAPTLAGRRVFLGYSPWASGAGYKVDPRKAVIKQFYEAPDRDTACALLTKNKIDYFVVSPDERTTHNFKLNPGLLLQFPRVKSVGTGTDTYDFYSVGLGCSTS